MHRRDCDSILSDLHEHVRQWWQASDETRSLEATAKIKVTLDELRRSYPFEGTKGNFHGNVLMVKEEFAEGAYMAKLDAEGRQGNLDYGKLTSQPRR